LGRVLRCGQPAQHGRLCAVQLFNSWLGQRINDMLTLPLDRFDPERPIWLAQSKTGAHVVLPWQMVPELQTRASSVRERCCELRTKGLLA
jgi:hypothetical protein